MTTYNCNTLVAVSLLCSRVEKISTTLFLLNKNVLCIVGYDFEFKSHHIDQAWEYMRCNQPEYYSFALTLKEEYSPRMESVIDRFGRGTLYKLIAPHDEEEVNFETLMRTHRRFVNPALYALGGTTTSTYESINDREDSGEDDMEMGIDTEGNDYDGSETLVDSEMNVRRMEELSLTSR
jgi:hypothetical protein